MKTLTLVEAARFLKMHPQTVRRMALRGELPGAKPGKCWVFIDDDLASWLRTHYISSQPSSNVRESKSNSRSSENIGRPSSDRKYLELLGLPKDTHGKRK